MNNFFGRKCTCLEIEISWPDRNDARCRPAAVSRWSRAQFSGGVCTVEVIPQNAVFDNGRRLSRYTFIVKWAGAQAGRHSRVIYNGYVGGGNRLPDLINKERAASINGASGDGFKDMAQQRTRA